MTGSPVLGLITYAVAGLALGLGYRALRVCTQQRACQARHPELVVVAGLFGRMAGLAGLVALVSRGAVPAFAALAIGFGVSWLVGRGDAPVGPEDRTGLV